MKMKKLKSYLTRSQESISVVLTKEVGKKTLFVPQSLHDLGGKDFCWLLHLFVMVTWYSHSWAKGQTD